MSVDHIIDQYLNELQNIYSNFDKDISIIKKACKVAKTAHKLQFRKYSGEPYITHPLSVSIMIAKKTDNLPIILAAILHDTVEDSPDLISMKFIYDTFGDEVWYLVDAVTDNILYFYWHEDKRFKCKLDKLLTWAMKDARCAVLKLEDREHNNKTLEWLKTDKQIRKSFETQALYKPLRSILRLDETDFVLKDTCKLLWEYLKTNNIKTKEDLKSNLYNITFQDIDNDNFNLFYYNSDSIVWEIEDKKMFEELIKNENFDESIDLISMRQNVDWKFSCLFKYKKWKVFDKNIKVKISSFKY